MKIDPNALVLQDSAHLLGDIISTTANCSVLSERGSSKLNLNLK
jgi:hypothetical protein